VLVVEDDALDYKMIVRMLGEDFEVTRAHQLTDAELRATRCAATPWCSAARPRGRPR
jgi:hypothetical protein